MNDKEKVIQFLINQYNNSNSNPIQIDRKDISVLQIPEIEIIKILNTLHEDHLITAKPKSPHKDFSAYWDIIVTYNCLNYFNKQKKERVLDKRDRTKTYIPIILSIISIIISVVSLVISIIKLTCGL